MAEGRSPSSADDLPEVKSCEDDDLSWRDCKEIDDFSKTSSNSPKASSIKAAITGTGTP